VDEDIRVATGSVEPLQSGLGLQVYGYRAFAPVETVKVECIAIVERLSHPAGIVSAIDTFDFQDVCAKIRQDHPCEWAGEHLPYFNDFDALQGL